MELTFPNLDDDPRTRVYMVEELELDVPRNEIYRGTRLTEAGWQAWPGLLREALKLYEPKWLELQSKQAGYWLSHETSRRGGKEYPKAVPVDAAQTLAEGQFVRYYLRAVGRRAMDDGHDLKVVRLARHGVVVVPEAVVQRHLRVDAPFILRVADVILLLEVPRSGRWHTA